MGITRWNIAAFNNQLHGEITADLSVCLEDEARDYNIEKHKSNTEEKS
jgi:hypothetical protein